MGAEAVSTIVLVLVFAAVVIAVMGIAAILDRRVDLRRRLRSGSAVAGAADEATLRMDQTSAWSARAVAAVERYGISLDASATDPQRETLQQAGYLHPAAPRFFELTRIVLTLTLPLLAIVPMILAHSSSSPFKLFMWISGLALLGRFLPNIYVGHRRSKRREEILNGFPDTLDLMLVCIDAGLGIDACFKRVGAEIVRSHPLLADQFAIVALELRAGSSRDDALRGLARRTAIPEIGAFVTLLVQAQRLGSSIAQALRIYAVEMRESRRMRAEEKAHQIPVLLSIPLVVFMLPTMMSVLMLPGVIMVMHNVIPKIH